LIDPIQREAAIHGATWGTFHGGYFSDPAVAAPLVGKILEYAGASQAEAIVDLGGGTGYLLSRLRACGLGPDVSLIDLDESARQLESAGKSGLACVRAAVDQFSRRDLSPGEKRFLFMMRSVLHYFGEDGLPTTLRHVRAQARPGEFFIHQSASFQDGPDAEFMNALYQLMQTRKWYPTVAALEAALTHAGWRVLDVRPGPALPLLSADLGARYGLDRDAMRHISRTLSGNHPVKPGVFEKQGDDFCAFLHYWIYVCTPA
jgi:hypothetical protein